MKKFIMLLVITILLVAVMLLVRREARMVTLPL